tara:strand:- start:57 stop:278 length:222 start_codon:yes stop_codon:yes gene_type:complete
MKEREYMAKHGHETIGGINRDRLYAKCTISKDDVLLATKDDQEIIRIMREKIKKANKALIEAANEYYCRMLDE